MAFGEDEPNVTTAEGADIFALSTEASGPARITDFDLSADQILVFYGGETAPTFSELTVMAKHNGAVVELAGAPLATVDGVRPCELTSASFVFLPLSPSGRTAHPRWLN